MGSKKSKKPAKPPASPPVAGGGFMTSMASAVGAAILVGLGRKIAVDLYDAAKSRLTRKRRAASPKQDT